MTNRWYATHHQGLLPLEKTRYRSPSPPESTCETVQVATLVAPTVVVRIRGTCCMAAFAADEYPILMSKHRPEFIAENTKRATDYGAGQACTASMLQRMLHWNAPLVVRYDNMCISACLLSRMHTPPSHSFTKTETAPCHCTSGWEGRYKA